MIALAKHINILAGWLPCRNKVKVMKREVGIALLSQRVSVGVKRHRMQSTGVIPVILNKASELRIDCIASMLRLRWECPLQHQSIALRAVLVEFYIVRYRRIKVVTRVLVSSLSFVRDGAFFITQIIRVSKAYFNILLVILHKLYCD